MFQAKGLLVQRSWERARYIWEWMNGVEWNEQGRECWKMRLGDRQELECSADTSPTPTFPPPWSALFRNSTNQKSFLSDHLIKQDYPDLLRVWNLPVERLWLQEFNQLGTDSKDPYPGCSMANPVKGVSYSTTLTALKRLPQRGEQARVCTL